MRTLVCGLSAGLLLLLCAASAHGQLNASSAEGAARSLDPVPEGLGSDDWAGIRAAYDAGRHEVFAVEGGHRARNPGQQWTTHFDGRGFTTSPDAGDWTWGLQLEAYGWGNAESVAAASAVVITDGQQVSYAWDARLTEWYINDQRGLEHGYTVHARPEDAIGALAFDLSIRGGHLPVVSADGRDVRFVDATGGTVLNYSGLTVFDADSQPLAAGWEAGDGRLHLRIEDQAARYPLTIDPVAQQAYLKASNTDVGDQFGHAVAISGNTVVVGAFRESSAATGVNGDQSSNAAAMSGAAYVFVRNGTTWTQQAYLKASNAGAGDVFGWAAVAVAGDTVVVGASNEGSAATGVNGDESSNAKTWSGAAYVFVRNGTTWTQQAYLKASNTDGDDHFGAAVAVSGDTVVVGAPFEDSAAAGVDGNQGNNDANQAGAAYVFARSGATWTQQSYLKASNAEAVDRFGSSVAVSGNTVVVGAPLEDSAATGVEGNQFSNAASHSGAAYVFVPSGTTWTQQAYLKASNTGQSDGFGTSVAVSGDTIVVGALYEDSAATGVDGDQSSNAIQNPGAAYVFVRNGTNWSQQAYLKASNTEADDGFSASVAVSGNTVVVGAPYERSAATGVNGDQSNNNAIDSGAAYIFVRSGTTWAQSAYLKASNTGGSDQFGTAVAISGDTVIVGAPLEDSAATGVNGNQSIDSAFHSGAAYVFDLDFAPFPWTDVGSGLAGVTGVPVLVGAGSLIGGTPMSLALSSASPHSTTAIILGLSLLDAPFKGGTLVPLPDLLITGLSSNGDGALVLGATWPTGLPSGLSFWVQEWIADPTGPQGLSASNGLRGTTP